MSAVGLWLSSQRQPSSPGLYQLITHALVRLEFPSGLPLPFILCCDIYYTAPWYIELFLEHDVADVQSM